MGDGPGRGRWNDPLIPHKGWELVDVDDLGAPSHVCEMCLFHPIRYVHRLVHSERPDLGHLLVGCVCAEHLCADYVIPRAREKALRRRARWRDNWTHRVWREIRASPVLDRPQLRLSVKGTVFCVYRTDDGFYGQLWTGEGWTGGRKAFASFEQVALVMFDYWWPPKDPAPRGTSGQSQTISAEIDRSE